MVKFNEMMLGKIMREVSGNNSAEWLLRGSRKEVREHFLCASLPSRSRGMLQDERCHQMGPCAVQGVKGAQLNWSEAALRLMSGGKLPCPKWTKT